MSHESEQLDLGFEPGTDSSTVAEDELKHQAELAIGEYLARGRKVWPEMPMARVLKALERQGIAPELAPRALALIGATVTRIPEYVAKYNYRVTFTQSILDRCQQIYREQGDF
jgi:hypothetical protein